MLEKILTACLLAMLLAAPGVEAQTAAAGTAQPAANPVDPGAIQALKDMGAHLQTLKRFQVSTELTGERVLTDGQKLQHVAAADLDVERPNRVRARMISARSERQIIYDGKTVTQKRYSLGTKNKNLRKGADGSLTLYVGAKSPGADKESNWLPAPDGHFSLYIRAYWGQQGILDGSWKPPVIRKAK